MLNRPSYIVDKQAAEIKLRKLWQAGNRMSVEAFLQQHPKLASDRQQVLDLIYAEFLLRKGLGESASPAEYHQRFPAYATELKRLFEVHFAVGIEETRDVVTSDQPPASGSNDGQKSSDVLYDRADNSASVPVLPIQPVGAQIGRYQICEIMGEGGFGIVYKALDTMLKRDVAIKIPHLRHGVEQEAYLSEAESVARLDHPGIVPVFDVGRTPSGQCYVVSKFISGGSLEGLISKGRVSITDAVEMVAAIAVALHHAHQRGLVHRDIKPANILVDEHGQPLLADFGLALRDENFGQGGHSSGTPAYMSPEQARGESHLVDARSDIYSLGVVFYLLLTGRRPYRSRSPSELLNEIVVIESRPPRQLDDSIPEELDRICIKALAKRPSDRYSTAIDFCNDLRRWLAKATPAASSPHVVPAAGGFLAGKFGLGTSVLAVALAVGCLLLFGRSWIGRHGESVISDRQDSASNTSEAAASSGAATAGIPGVNIEVHVQRAAEKGSFRILTEEHGPLHDNDRVQLHVRSDRPRYCYVYWCDPHSGPQRLWPKDLSGQRKVSEVAIPEGRDEWLPVLGGRGNEMVVAAATDRPLQLDDVRDFERSPSFSQISEVVARPYLFPVDVDAHGSGTERGVGKTITSIKVPLTETFEESLKAKFDVYRGMIFPHE